MSSRDLPKASAVLAIIGLALTIILTGCPSPANNGHLDPVVTSVAVVPASNHGVVFDGEEGVLNYLITIVGEGVFPIDLQDADVVVTHYPGGQPLVEGITVNEGTVVSSGEAFPLGFTVDIPVATAYMLVVTVRGVSSAPFELLVTPASVVTSVSVVPDPENPGTIIAGISGTANYLITISSIAVEEVFPVDLLGPYVEVTLVDGAELPGGITVNRDMVTTPGVASSLSFSVNRPVAAVYSLVVRVHGRRSDPFYLVVEPALTGTVVIEGTVQIGQTLVANIGDLDGNGDPSFQWHLGTPDFTEIPGETGPTYYVRAGDLNHTIKVIVTREGYYGYAIGGPTIPVTRPGDTPLTGTVTITYDEILQVGQTLTAGIADLHGSGTPAFQWQRGTGVSFLPILGATGSTYVMGNDDAGWFIRVVVTRIGYSGYVASESTAAVERRPTVAEQIAALHMMPAVQLPSEITITAAESYERIAFQTLMFARPIRITLEGGSPGDTLYLARAGTMFTVGSGVTLVLRDIALRGMGTAVSNNNALVVVNNGGALVMDAGSVIADNNNVSGAIGTQGGGVRINDGGTFTMEGGEVSGNDASWGAGVFVAGFAFTGTFTMRGGEILDNFAGEGGGVLVGTHGIFTMEGGVIRANRANVGGGVVNFGTMTMASTEISTNLSLLAAGGVLNSGSFTMRSGEISRNITLSQQVGGGGVFNEGTFNMEGGMISLNRAENPAAGGQASGGGVVNWSGGVFNMHPGTTIRNNLASTFGGGVINLGAGAFTMHGGIIDLNMAGQQGGGVNNNTGGTFTMYDGTIHTNMSAIGGGVASVGNFTMVDGRIRSNDAHQGGGVRVNDGTFTMEGGEIYDNWAALGIPGSIETGGGVSNLSVFNMYGGVIGGLRAGGEEDSGRNRSLVGGGVENRGLFAMRGGTILDNDAIQGGGVENRGLFVMHSDGVISGNEAEWGGGVLNQRYFDMRGGAISGNTARHANSGGGVENFSGIFWISDGIIHGSDASVDLRNVGGGFDALFNFNGVTDGGTAITSVAQYGTFNNGDFDPEGDLSSTNSTIEVMDGVLERPLVADAGILSLGVLGIYDRSGLALPLPRGLMPRQRRVVPLDAGFTLSIGEAALPEGLVSPSSNGALEQRLSVPPSR